MKNFITQTDIVLAELKNTKLGITSWDMIERHRITRLAAHIHALKKKGFDIEANRVYTKGGNYTRYTLNKGR